MPLSFSVAEDFMVGLIAHRFQCSNFFTDSLSRLNGRFWPENKSTRDSESRNSKSVTNLVSAVLNPPMILFERPTVGFHHFIGTLIMNK